MRTWADQRTLRGVADWHPGQMASLDGALLVCVHRVARAVHPRATGCSRALSFGNTRCFTTRGEAIADHIVWYNNDHNSGWRIFSMPADDLLYGLLLIGMNVSLYEAFRVPWKGPRQRHGLNRPA